MAETSKNMNAILRYTLISCLRLTPFERAAERKYKNEVENSVVLAANPRIVVRNAGVSTNARHYGNMDGNGVGKFRSGDRQLDGNRRGFFSIGRKFHGDSANCFVRSEPNNGLRSHRQPVELVANTRHWRDGLWYAFTIAGVLHSSSFVRNSCEHYVRRGVWSFMDTGGQSAIRLPTYISRNPNEKLGQPTSHPLLLGVALSFS